MGRKARMRPERLAEKLRQIRTTLGISQSEMLMRLGFQEVINLGRMSDYEQGTNEPPLQILLEYARAAHVPLEVLVDDELDLPERLPGTANHEEITLQYASRSKRTGKR